MEIVLLIFILLIENVFKYGIFFIELSFIYIFIFENKEEIWCEICNSYYFKINMDKSGLGIGFE